jgi:hypothetical protein
MQVDRSASVGPRDARAEMILWAVFCLLNDEAAN